MLNVDFFFLLEVKSYELVLVTFEVFFLLFF